MNRILSPLFIASVLALAPACAVELDDAKPDADDTKTGPNGKAEAWSAADDPSGFSTDLEKDLTKLPQAGEATNVPWAANYWPVYQDSINSKWDGAGTDSATTKYAKAFGYDPKTVEDKVSQYHGIDSQSFRKTCTTSSDCSEAGDGSCSIRAGETEGRCIPTWFGICHAWAPLAILKPEPLHEVEYNGVTFKVNDIKALTTLVYNRTRTRFVSTRCNTDSSDVHFDNYGRPTGVDIECRDTNPGTLHMLLTNYLGLKGESFVEDRTWDDEVWNQPIRGYRVTKQDVVSARDANELVGVTSAGGQSEEASGTVAKSEWFHMNGIDVSNGKTVSVVMTGSGDADLYVRFGAQPTANEYDCRPYAGSSAENCDLTAASDTQVFVSVNGYADSSNFEVKATVGGSVPNDYAFNDYADKFYHVKIEVDYITESSASTDGYLGDRIDDYTNTDRYEYILEIKTGANGAEEIVGGEYIGASKQDHPDFLWLPVSHRGESVAGGAIKRSEVMAIYELSRQTDGGDDGGGETIVLDESGTVARYDVKQFGPFEVKAGEKLSATMTGTADADLYVRLGAAPTQVAYDCRPYKNGSDEKCDVVSNGSKVYVAVMGYAASSDFELHIEYVKGGGTTDPVAPPADVTHLNETSSLAQGEAKHFTIDLPAGYATKINTYSQDDVDLYIQLNEQPTTNSYLMRAWTTSGNETLNYTPQANATLHILVYGYENADSFTLTTSRQ